MKTAGVLFAINSIQSDNLSDLSKQNIEAMAHEVMIGTVLQDPLIDSCWSQVESYPSPDANYRPVFYCNPRDNKCIRVEVTYASGNGTCISQN